MKTIPMNILDVTEGFICQQVNCKHVMGAGLAKQIRTKWPEVYHYYMETPAVLGNCTITLVSAHHTLFVVNLYGQDSYGKTVRHTNYGAVSHALHHLQRIQQDLKQPIPTYFPYGLGCGLGGGEWPIISELIEFYFPDAIICQLP